MLLELAVPATSEFPVAQTVLLAVADRLGIPHSFKCGLNSKCKQVHRLNERYLVGFIDALIDEERMTANSRTVIHILEEIQAVLLCSDPRSTKEALALNHSSRFKAVRSATKRKRGLAVLFPFLHKWDGTNEMKYPYYNSSGDVNQEVVAAIFEDMQGNEADLLCLENWTTS
jgi:hypothetical protein